MNSYMSKNDIHVMDELEKEGYHVFMQSVPTSQKLSTEEIKDKFGMDVVRFRRKSDGMTLIQSDIDEALKRVCLIYSNEETIMEYQMIFNYKEQSHGYDVEDKKIKEEQMIVDGNKINIKKF